MFMFIPLSIPYRRLGVSRGGWGREGTWSRRVTFASVRYFLGPEAPAAEQCNIA